MNLDEHKKSIAYYSGILLEMAISGYNSKMDAEWWIIRIGIILLMVSCVHTKKKLVLKVTPFLLAFLFLSGMRDKWQAIAKDKLSKQENSYSTKVKEPIKPIIENCDSQPKYARPECLQSNKDLQASYAKDLRVYNSRILKSETDIRAIEIELTFFEQIPVWIYLLISVTSIVLTFLTTFEENKIENEIVIQEETTEEKESRIKAEIIRRLLLKESKLSIAKIYGKTWRNIRDIENELYGRKHNECTMNAQSEKVVNIREVKRGA